MTSKSAAYAACSSTNIVHRGETGAGAFMIRLCRLVEPVSIRPPQSPHLKPFTFFTSRAHQPDGSEPLYLHMGFFDTLADAERWARAVRARHPGAMASIAPPAFRQPPDSDESAWPSVELTDTQVLDILERRRPAAGGNDDERGIEQIELLRPDDTVSRRALKEAVVEGAPVSFAVQLNWSARPIDASCVPPLPILKAYTLYAVESRRANRSCFFLRLGFFGNPVSAKQVASHLRSSFASAAVVPVLEEEITRAREACADLSVIPCLVQQRLDPALEFTTSDGARPRPKSGRPRGATYGTETLEQTLAQLAERELWNDRDSLSDTGVRHLKVEIEERTPASRH
ncbi:MAG: hypothetical protein WBW93_20440 [Steroidobacteraceae bacterium]